MSTMQFKFANQTGGAFKDDQIFFAIIGLSGTTWSYVTDSGTLEPLGSSGNVKFYSLQDLPAITVPEIVSARAYFGMGAPLVIKIVPDGFQGPDPGNPTDPNAKLYYDWIEFTFSNNTFHGNTTQVDQFGFPLTIELASSAGTEKVGIAGGRAGIFTNFPDHVPAEFQGLVQAPYRIIAPFHGSFTSGGANADYFHDYIEEIWANYAKQPLVFRLPQGKFTGRVHDDQFVFTENGQPTKYVVGKPTSPEVFACNGVFATGSDIEKVIEAQLAAAFNRRVMNDGSKFCNTAAYYPSGKTANWYAEFWHPISLRKKAYGFPFDDVCNQSTLVAGTSPVSLNISLAWD